MALDPEAIEARQRPLVLPLPTGFKYRKPEDVPGFEIDPELLKAAGQEMERLDTLHIPPANYQDFMARGAIQRTE